jgi:hypothetical protein
MNLDALGLAPSNFIINIKINNIAFLWIIIMSDIAYAQNNMGVELEYFYLVH